MPQSADIDFRIKSIRSHLQDELSQRIFDLRLRYHQDKDYGSLLEGLWELMENEPLINYEMRDMVTRKGPRMLVYGSGHLARWNHRILSLSGMRVLGVVQETSAVELLAEPYKGAIVVVATPDPALACRRLVSLGVDESLLHIPKGYSGVVVVNKPMQYFDHFRPRRDEVFLDVGAYDGQSSVDFGYWTAGMYERVICMEPMEGSLGLLRSNTAHLGNIEILPYAAWNKRELLSMHQDGGASTVIGSGGITVQAERIDDAVDAPVTFLKMDVEGSECKALEGAAETIRHNKPRLAISVYHRAGDILRIPSLILDLVPDYRFWLRHYSGMDTETILFASCEDEDTGMGVQKWQLPRAARLSLLLNQKRNSAL